MDYYYILGVHRDASAHAIKQAYRRLAFQFHPDRNPNDKGGALKRMQVINEAYDVLSDSKKRRFYDQRGPGITDQKQQTAKAAPVRNLEQERLAEEAIREFERQLKAFGTSRFESKDGIFGITLAFLMMSHLPQGQQLMPSVAFLLFAIVCGLICRGLARATYLEMVGRNPDSFIAMMFTNVVAAIVMTNIAQLAKQKFGVEYFHFPPLVTMLVTLIPSVVGAAFGRAFNGALGTFAGMIGGSFIGGVVAGAFGFWSTFLQTANPRMANSGTVIDSFKIILIAAITASAIGSMRLGLVQLFSVLDVFESLFDRLSRRPGSKSRALVPVKKD